LRPKLTRGSRPKPAASPPQVVLLANLYPAEAGVEELDSHMFQTVGHGVVSAYAQCCALPLLRRRIRGASLHLGLEYAASPGDEVEDLRALLAAAKAAVPDLGGVCSGAILSDYQRLRVEAVATSLGLTSLAYLWRRNQASLLREMGGCGLEAVLVKVAALGLRPEAHLGRSLRELTPLLRRLERKHGCHACGEGGEYETLTLDAPTVFSGGRLVLDDTQAVAEPGGGGVGHLRVMTWHVEPRGENAPPPAVTEVEGDAPPPPASPPPPTAEDAAAAQDAACIAATRGAGAWSYAARPQPQSDSFASAEHTSEEAAAAEQLRLLLLALDAALRADGLGWSDALLVTLLLRDMSHFGACNAAYVAVVPRSGPPARACVAAPLPPGALCAVDVTARSPAARAAGVQRIAMHVQSVSAWAPACIGPYAQATRCGGLVHVAGQLGLDPASMTLQRGLDGLADASLEAVAATQAAEAVATAMRAPLRRAAVAATLYATSAAAAKTLAEAWNAHLDGRTPPRPGFGPDGASSDDEDEGRGKNDDAHPAADAWRFAWRPLQTRVIQPALPRAAAVELQPLALEPDVASWGEDCGDDPLACADGDASAVWVPGRFLRAHAPGAPAEAAAALGAALARAGLAWPDAACLRVFHAPGGDNTALRAAWDTALHGHGVAPVLVPCCGVASGDGPPLPALAELTAWRPAQLQTS